MAKVTMKMIADKVSVSTMAVSAAFKNSKKVSPETRRRILEAADALGYRPNFHATSMRRGQNGFIGLLLSENPGKSHLFDQLFSGILSEVEKQGQQLIIHRIPDSVLSDELKLRNFLRSWTADGMLVYYTHGFPPVFHDFLAKYHIPAVWINSKGAQNCVYSDDFAAAKQATDLFIEAGLSNIAYFDMMSRTEEQQHYNHVDRHDGYVSAMQGANLKPTVISNLIKKQNDRFAACREWFKENGLPEAVIGRSPNDVTTALCAAESLQGCCIPDKMQAIGFSTEPLLHTGREISAMMVPMQELGSSATKMLMKRLAQKNKDIPSIQIPLDFKEACTTKFKKIK